MLHLATLLLLSAAGARAFQIQQPLHESSSSSSETTIKLNHEHNPLVSSEAIQGDINSKNLLKRAEKLFEIAQLGKKEYNHPTRVIGSEGKVSSSHFRASICPFTNLRGTGHIGTLEYIYSTLSSLGDYYTLSNQTFNAVVGNVFEYRLVLGDHSPPSTQAMSLTPPTPKKDAVFGQLLSVENDGCHVSDYPTKTPKNWIAFIRRGTCAFGDKSSAAGKAGAVAAVIYNNENGTLSGTLGQPDKNHIATFGISNEDAQVYLKDLKAGKKIESSAYVDAIVRNTGTTNIIAQTKGGDQENCVMLGGHSDSVAEGPGINDDGTGSLTLLEIASQLTKYSVNNCVRFAWWAGEEEGLLGSDYYVSQLSEKENLKIRLFMDYDMLASPNYAYQVYNATNAVNPTGSEELRDLYTDWYKSHGLNFTYIPFDGRSDYDAFIKNGIPGGGIATGAEGVKTKEEEAMFGGTAGKWFDPCYHQLCDTFDNLAVGAWELNTKLVAHSVATYAVSFKGFPERTSVKYNRIEDGPPRFHGPKLVM